MHIKKVIDDIMKEFENKVDTVILGCTHFGYFTEEIMKTVKPVRIVESSYELAKYVKKYLEERNMLNNHGTTCVEFIK